MKKKVCKMCGVILDTKRKTAQFCSYKCSSRYNYRSNSAFRNASKARKVDTKKYESILCKRLLLGYSLDEIAGKKGIPCELTLYKRMREDASFKKKILQSRRQRCTVCSKLFPGLTKRKLYCGDISDKNSCAGKKYIATMKTAMKSYRKRHPGAILKNTYSYIARFPDKHRAYSALYARIKDGRETPSSNCQGCGKQGKTVATFQSYLHPVKYQWMCRPCSRKYHASLY